MIQEKTKQRTLIMTMKCIKGKFLKIEVHNHKAKTKIWPHQPHCSYS